ncbi:hypothetical protein MHAEM_21156 [Mycolicibacterium phlei]|nr:hypothetical protein [Mycolicibacterium phlei]
MPPGAEPVTGEWKRAKNNRQYFKPFQREAEEYGRASSAGEHLKGSGEALANFKAAHAAIGVVMSDSVRSRVATLINQYKGDPYYAGDDGGSQSGKSRLLEAVELACEVAGANAAAEEGTEFHGLWELANAGKEPTVIQPHLKQRLDHYLRKTKPIRFIDAECLVVNDEIKRAGSMDHLAVIPKGAIGPYGEPLEEDWVVGADGKTGRWDARYPAGVYAQLATYVLGHRYNQDTNERTEIHPELRKDWGVLIHYPLAEKEPDVGFYWLDLEVGRQAALLNNRIDAMIKYFESARGKPIPFVLEQQESKT